MQIKRIHIEGFRAIDDVSLDLCDELGDPRGIATLAGPNGCGKTSILYAVTNALRGVLGYRARDVPDPSRDDMRVGQASGSAWSPKPSDVVVDVDIHISKEEQDDIRHTLVILEKQPPPEIPNDTLSVHWTFPPKFGPDGRRLPWHYSDITPSVSHVRSWFQVKSWAIKAWRNGTPGIGDQLPKLGGLHFFPQDRDLRRRIGSASLSSEELKAGRRSSANQPTVFDVLDEFSRRFAKDDSNDPSNWEAHVKRLYNSICSPKEYLGFLYREDTPDGSPVFREGQHSYPLSHAASGEHVILEYIIELCRYGPLNRSIILIDEPEVHLHPLWLRRLYLSLPKIGDANQFVLTTHSPELRERAASDNCLIELGSLQERKDP